METKNRFTKAIGLFFCGLLISTASSCDLIGSSEQKEGESNAQFSYEMYDGSGDLLKKVDQTRVGEIEIETSLGLFGDNFLPPFIAEHSEIDPGLLKMHEIVLHAEEGINEDVRFVTLRFTFPNMEQWQKGSYQFPEISREEWVEQLKKIRERLQQNHPDTLSKRRSIRTPGASVTFSDEQLATMNYMETGLLTGHHFGTAIEPSNHFYTASGGTIELKNVTKDRVEGQFRVDLFSLPMAEVFFADEFPEDPEIQSYRIVGDFVTEPGNFSDLQETRADLFDLNTSSLW